MAAWVTLWAAFAVFCAFFLVLVVTLVNFYLNSTYGRDAKLTIIGGTVLVKSSNTSLWVMAEPDSRVEEGFSIKTDVVSQTFVTLFDYSTALVLSGTEIQFARMASPRFSGRKDRVELSLEWGKVQLGVSPPVEKSKSFLVRTPHATLDLEDGSFYVIVDGDGTHLRVRERGYAWVEAGKQKTQLGPDERIDVSTEGRLTTPATGTLELVFNGDFSRGLSGWQEGQYLGFQEGKDVVGKASVVLEEGRTALRFARYESKGTHSEVYVYQEIDRDVSDLSELYPHLELKLVHQSLSGGGYMGSEYPIILRVNYRMAGGAESSVLYGFYYQNEMGNRTDNGERLLQNQWYLFEVPLNLMSLNPKPQRILSIQVSASGWDYESLVRRVSLTGK